MMQNARLRETEGGTPFWLSPETVDAVCEFLDQPVAAAPANPLSTRELEVLRLLAAGDSNSDIARRLVISENTVLHHVSSILRKTGSRNRAQAISHGFRTGLIE